MPSPTLDAVLATMFRLFIDDVGAAARKEDVQKAHELVGILGWLAQVKKGAHVVDAAAGKASVGFVAAELLPFDRVTVLERDADRIAACRAIAPRLRAGVTIDVRHADVGDVAPWPPQPDAVVALHACGPAADQVIDGAIACGARQLFLAPCCYGRAIAFRKHAEDVVRNLDFVADDLMRRRMTASLVDVERKLRLEAAGYEADLEEFVAPTITPHNVLFVARRTGSDVRIARAKRRLDQLRSAAAPRS
jgi:hypothetical protein